jgi:hypothetical protein
MRHGSSSPASCPMSRLALMRPTALDPCTHGSRPRGQVPVAAAAEAAAYALHMRGAAAEQAPSAMSFSVDGAML